MNRKRNRLWAQYCAAAGRRDGGPGEKDHSAIVLRFFEGKDLKAVGTALGVSEKCGEDAGEPGGGEVAEVFRQARGEGIGGGDCRGGGGECDAGGAGDAGEDGDDRGAGEGDTTASLATLVLVKGGAATDGVGEDQDGAGGERDGFVWRGRGIAGGAGRAGGDGEPGRTFKGCGKER